MPASGNNWSKVLAIFEAVAEVPAEGRNVFLESLNCDPVVAKEVRALLATFEGDTPAAALVPERRTQEFLGKYKLTGILGHGGMGRVYSALDTELDRAVALKFLSLESCPDHSLARRLKREAKALSAVNHPNIVTVHEIIEADSRLAIVMELVTGDPLRALIGAPFLLTRLLRLAEQIAQALAAAHAEGVIHRDIKPENMIVRPDGYLKLLDFGLAWQADNGQNSTGNLTAGTVRYMSPEQARFEPLTSASDIFSSGLILYELATGVHPFEAASPLEVMYAAATWEPKPPQGLNPSLPSRLSDLILAMLSKKAATRPSAREAAETLREIRMAHEQLSSLAAPDGQSSPRSPLLWRLIAAASLLILAGISAWVLRRAENRVSTNPELRVQPLTSQVGWEASPALSPDSQDIAFTWTERLNQSSQIYVKSISADKVIKLTNSDDGTVGSLVWSPDGKQIAFRRWYGDHGAIYSMPSSGGKELKITELANSDASSSLDWSPDGTQLAFSDRAAGSDGKLSVYLLNLITAEKRKLTSPPTMSWGDWDPRFSPDGSQVAFKRVTGFWLDDVYVIPSSGGVPHRVTSEEHGVWGHSWISDGNGLIVSCQRDSTIFQLWRFPLSSRGTPQRITNGGQDAITPTSARKTNRIAWVNQTEDLNVYRIPASGSTVPVRLIASTLRDFGQRYSPAGKIAFVSDRGGTRNIWISDADGHNQVRVTSIKSGGPISDLDWSPNGRDLAFSAQQGGKHGIFVLSCEPDGTHCADPKQLTWGESAESSPVWSSDGRYLYFASDRSGRNQIWRQPSSGGAPVQITQNGGYLGRESFDGRWLYFSRWGGDSIWRIPGSRPNSRESVSSDELVISLPYHPQPTGWTITSDEIFFVDRTGLRSVAIRARNLSTSRTRTILTLPEVLTDRSDTSVAVSPDGRWVTYTQLDRSGSNVMVTDESR